MTNKDTVFIYSGGFLCFIYGNPSVIYGEGNSLSLYNYKYFHWIGKLPNDLRPIGQRCILQW